MAIKPPTDDELRELARANQIDLTPAEVRSLGAAIAGQMRGFERIMAIAPEQQSSVTRYPKRDPGVRADRAGDPLNAVRPAMPCRWRNVWKLAGKRIGLKDSVCVAGIPASGGSHVLQGYVADSDATIVTRMLDAGAEIVATLNMDDFALSGDGLTSAYGPTHNPHNPEHCSGGSSSGSGAALYYDWIDITIGTDQGGSIRIPSSWCGVVGLMPTYGLVPYTGVMSIDPSVDHVGPMARTVKDVALMLEVIAGRDPLDHRQLRDFPVPQYTATLDRGVKGKRLGLLREGFSQPGAEDDVSHAVRAAAAQLEKLGAKVEEVSVPEHVDAGDLLFAIIPEGMTHLMRTGLVGAHHTGIIQRLARGVFRHSLGRAREPRSVVGEVHGAAGRVYGAALPRKPLLASAECAARSDGRLRRGAREVRRAGDAFDADESAPTGRRHALLDDHQHRSIRSDGPSGIERAVRDVQGAAGRDDADRAPLRGCDAARDGVRVRAER